MACWRLRHRSLSHFEATDRAVLLQRKGTRLPLLSRLVVLRVILLLKLYNIFPRSSRAPQSRSKQVLLANRHLLYLVEELVRLMAR